MNCGVDLTNPRAAFDACMSIIETMPNWPQMLALGTATAATVGFLAVMLLIIIRSSR
jgi:hypothetical protein